MPENAEPAAARNGGRAITLPLWAALEHGGLLGFRNLTLPSDLIIHRGPTDQSRWELLGWTASALPGRVKLRRAAECARTETPAQANDICKLQHYRLHQRVHHES
jgi:hypothetical protein